MYDGVSGFLSIVFSSFKFDIHMYALARFPGRWPKVAAPPLAELRSMD
jgi:hypothetical protein